MVTTSSYAKKIRDQNTTTQMQINRETKPQTSYSSLQNFSRNSPLKAYSLILNRWFHHRHRAHVISDVSNNFHNSPYTLPYYGNPLISLKPEKIFNFPNLKLMFQESISRRHCLYQTYQCITGCGPVPYHQLIRTLIFHGN